MRFMVLKMINMTVLIICVVMSCRLTSRLANYPGLAVTVLELNLLSRILDGSYPGCKMSQNLRRKLPVNLPLSPLYFVTSIHHTQLSAPPLCSFMLSIPASNVYPERVFSHLNIVCGTRNGTEWPLTW
jgi:hypothetical protein